MPAAERIAAATPNGSFTSLWAVPQRPNGRLRGVAVARKARFHLGPPAGNGQARKLAIGPLRDDNELRSD
jgi:hypothetical protein